MDIKEMVVGDKHVTFIHYKDSELWYRTDGGFEFPVPISDTGNATFLAKDRAILFMRYIRKQVALLEEAKAA
ncbi:MAG: hypothetical protein P4L91_02625 [Burkholderiaceae bacterium]|nr:hypothetical protein [Burkholderiaceae bacterium]